MGMRFQPVQKRNSMDSRWWILLSDRFLRMFSWFVYHFNKRIARCFYNQYPTKRTNLNSRFYTVCWTHSNISYEIQKVQEKRLHCPKKIYSPHNFFYIILSMPHYNFNDWVLFFFCFAVKRTQNTYRGLGKLILTIWPMK